MSLGKFIMKSLNISNHISKTLRIGLVATALSTLPIVLPVSAQVNPTTPDTTAPTTTTDRTDNVYNDDDSFDWGWLGLLGLIGLAGLKRKPEDQTYRRDINTNPSTTTRNL